MTIRTAVVGALALSALAAPAASAAPTPDLSSMAVDQTDLPSRTSVLAQGSVELSEDVPEYYRLFKLPRSSGFVRLNSAVILLKRVDDARLVLTTARAALGDPRTSRRLAKSTARELGVRARHVRVGSARPLHVGDGGFTVNIRVNRKIALVVGVFRLDRAIGEIDARGANGPAGLRGRTRGVLRVAADRIRRGLSPLSLTAPTVTGSPTVGSAVVAGPGTWSDATKPTSFSYAWQRCDAAGTCVAVSGATQPAYTATTADVGATLRVVVTAANAVGQTTAVSAPTTPVTAP